MNRWVVDASLHGKTVVAALRHWQSDLTWKAGRDLLAQRRVTINGVLCQDEARRVAANDVIEVSGRSLPRGPRATEICVLFLDDQIAVVEKPAGMLTERPAAERTARPKQSPTTPSLEELLPRVLAEYEGQRRSDNAIFMVHRLDRDASGLLVVARTPLARDRLTKQFAERSPSRIYRAIVSGRVTTQTIRTHFVRDRGDGKRGSVEHAAERRSTESTAPSLPQDAQLAITHVRPLASRRGHSLIECQLETGRTNQIRIHLSEIGAPICGDVKYGPAIQKAAAPRLALHAMELHFTHPTTGEPLHFQSEWPPELQLFWDKQT